MRQKWLPLLGTGEARLLASSKTPCRQETFIRLPIDTGKAITIRSSGRLPNRMPLKLNRKQGE
jgi:hypothetical protein